MSGEPQVVTLSLVSHTNVGKTTLARTLLRRDVGEVLDQAHVTLRTERFTLVEADGARLDLYDTPGLGDSARLLRRLRGESNPIGWFLSQVWDRVANRAMWCTQQAIKNARDDADVVLYLVNAAETPDDAGYVRHELDLLTWLERPVLLLLNQTGGPVTAPPVDTPDGTPPADAWRRHVAPWPIVRDVLPLDAFSRCWVQEGALFARLRPLVSEAQRPALDTCLAAWDARNREVFRASMERLAAFLAAAARDREPFEPGALWADRERARAMGALRGRLEQATRAMIDDLVRAHGLDGRSTRRLAEIFAGATAPPASRLTPGRGAIVGGVVSGALSGLAADLAAGGLTFGGGMVLGAVLGALGGATVAKGVQVVQGPVQRTVAWSPALLGRLFRDAVLHYLVVAHYGRGRGPYEDMDLPAVWSGLVDRKAAAHDAGLADLWPALAAGGGPGERALVTVVTECTASVLREAYPEADRGIG
jgi:hypothetical protein